MYTIALSVAACLRARTRVDVAWIVDTRQLDARDRTDAIAITPGGGRIGSLLSGALDGQLIDLANRQSAHGRLVELNVSEVDALIAGLHHALEWRHITASHSNNSANLAGSPNLHKRRKGTLDVFMYVSVECWHADDRVLTF